MNVTYARSIIAVAPRSGMMSPVSIVGLHRIQLLVSAALIESCSNRGRMDDVLFSIECQRNL